MSQYVSVAKVHSGSFHTTVLVNSWWANFTVHTGVDDRVPFPYTYTVRQFHREFPYENGEAASGEAETTNHYDRNEPSTDTNAAD